MSVCELVVSLVGGFVSVCLISSGSGSGDALGALELERSEYCEFGDDVIISLVVLTVVFCSVSLFGMTKKE